MGTIEIQTYDFAQYQSWSGQPPVQQWICFLFTLRSFPTMRQYAKSKGYFPTMVIFTAGQPHAKEHLPSLPSPQSIRLYEDLGQTLGLM
jgi:hypothetical protein